MSTTSNVSPNMFYPPVNRAMRVLDRSFFKKKVTLSAARIFDNKHISKFRSELGHDILKLDRLQSVQSIKGPKGEEHKALLLNPQIKVDGRSLSSGTELYIRRRLIVFQDASTWSSKLSELVKSSQIALTPYNLELEYNYWNYCK